MEKTSQPVQKPQKIVEKPKKSGGNRKKAPQKQKNLFIIINFRCGAKIVISAAAVVVTICQNIEITTKYRGGGKKKKFFSQKFQQLTEKLKILCAFLLTTTITCAILPRFLCV